MALSPFRASFAQQMNFVNVTGKLGLPATECYNVFQDRKGYIWISTEAGLCRYNGSSLQVFGKSNGLPERGIYAYTEDRHGVLWLVTCRNRILMYQDGQLTEAAVSKQYQKVYPRSLTYSIQEYDEGRLILQNYSNTYIVDVAKQSLQRIYRKGKQHQFFFEKQEDRLIPVNADYSYNRELRLSGLEMIFMNGRRADTTKVFLNPPAYRPNKFLSCRSGGYFFCSFGERLFRFSAGLEVHMMPQKSSIISLYRDKSNGIWVGMKESGVNYYPSGNEPGKYISLLNGFSVSGICEDREGNVWLTTLEKGLWVCKNKRLLSFAGMKGLDRPANMLKTVNGAVLASIDYGTVRVLSGFTERSFDLPFNPSDKIDDMISSGKDQLLVLKGALTYINARFQKSGRPGIQIPYIGNRGKLVQTDSSEYYLLGFSTLHKIHHGKARLLFTLPDKGGDLCLISRDSLLLGCRKGLFSFTRNDTTLHKIPGVDKTVTRIVKASDGAVWVATKEEGLYQFVQNKLKPIGRELGLKTDIFFDIAEDRHGNIWLGSNAGMIRLALPLNKQAVKYFNTTNGLPANEVFRLAADSQYIYVSTVEGISRMPLSDTGNIYPPPVYLSAFKVNGKDLGKPAGKRTLAYNENNIELNFDVLSFDLESQAGLWYRINKGAFVTQKGNILKLDNLEQGDYRLEVYGVTADGTKSARPVILSFIVAPAFWKTWWFLLAVSLLLSTLIYVLLEKRIAQIKRKAEEKSKLSRLISSYKLFALQAQMNPHFIFNSINSIQYFILKQKEQDAYQYLSRFSRLIRKVLEHSDKLSISLGQEISTLKDYITLEQYRFENKFDYELYIDADINTEEVSLPPMLIQPYVENAIWHGLLSLPKGSKGKLWLSFLLEGALLRIVIRDNGIGREKAAQKKNHTHTPVAMELTAKRLQIVHQIWGDATIRVNITDLYDEAQSPAGTQVELFLPLNIQLPEEEIDVGY